VVLRYCPLEMGGDKMPGASDIEIFIVCLEQQLVSDIAVPFYKFSPFNSIQKYRNVVNAIHTN
jgi:hypothetical protein